MLIIRPKDECIEGIRPNNKSNFALGSLVGGQVESAEAAARRGASADSGFVRDESRRRD